MDEDDSATPPDGSSGGGRQVVNRTTARIATLRRRLVELHTLINSLEDSQEQQGGSNAGLAAQIDYFYKHHAAITEELDFGSGWDAYDPDAIEPPPPQPIPTPAADENFVE